MDISEFVDKISTLLPILMKEFIKHQPEEIAKGKLGLPQVLVLQHLVDKDALKMVEIARFLKVSTPAATGIVERLVKAGYAERLFDKDDRRIIRVKVTSKGKTLLEKINQERRKIMLKIFSKVSEKDRKDYLRVLLKIKEILTSAEIKS